MGNTASYNSLTGLLRQFNSYWIFLLLLHILITYMRNPVDRDAIMRRLLSDRRVHADNIQIAVRGNTVTLKGSVPSLVDKTFASGIVHYVHGVKKVNNRLEVRFPNMF
jgi:hypothetical protein